MNSDLILKGEMKCWNFILKKDCHFLWWGKKKMSFGSQVQRMVCVPVMKTPAAAKSPVWKYQLAGEGNWPSSLQNWLRKNAQHFKTRGKTPSSTHISGAWSKSVQQCPGQVNNLSTRLQCIHLPKGWVFKYMWSYYDPCKNSRGQWYEMGEERLWRLEQ